MTFSAWPLGSEEYIIISNNNKNERLLKKKKNTLTTDFSSSCKIDCFCTACIQIMSLILKQHFKTILKVCHKKIKNCSL
jgi:hypothetical protein